MSGHDMHGDVLGCHDVDSILMMACPGKLLNFIEAWYDGATKRNVVNSLLTCGIPTALDCSEAVNSRHALPEGRQEHVQPLLHARRTIAPPEKNKCTLARGKKQAPLPEGLEKVYQHGE